MPVTQWFAYCGPNRRSDKTVVEVTLKYRPADRHGFPQQSSDIRDLLVREGILGQDETFPQQVLPADRMAWYASLLVQTALLFQKKAGHPVSFTSLSCDRERNRCVASMEYQHCEVGMTAVKLAVELLTGERKLLAEPFSMFREFALQRLLPIETRAIINAANRVDVPSIRLEHMSYRREDFAELTGGQCIRKNGLLMLGHGLHQRVLEGVFWLDNPNNPGGLKLLLADVEQRRALLDKLGIELSPFRETSTHGLKKFCLIAVNERVTAVADLSNGLILSPSQVHPSVIECAVVVNRALGQVPVAVEYMTEDISSPPAQTKGGVADFDLAPHFEGFPGGDADLIPDWMDSTAEAVIQWMFPDKSKTRMPIIAVTGTNGKTTTSRMINHIMTNAGHKPGLVCTDGIFLNGQELVKGDKCALGGHLKVLTSKAVDTAVLETHHAGILSAGFAFQWCDIAVCLNVSEDHLGKAYIDTVEQMAEVKQALAERGRYATVLNADDKYCLGMLEAVSAQKICLVSMESTAEDLALHCHDSETCFCVLESIKGEEWLVIHDEGQRLPVIAVAQIPAAFDGVARFNVSNAMHASVACYLAGTDIDSIRSAMRQFESNYQTTPGRMNVFDDLPFRIIMDFAHNPDGFRKISEFVSRQAVTGRKLVVFSGVGDRTDETLKKMSNALAGQFDFYFCKERMPMANERADRKRKVAKIMQKGLLEAGVAESQTALFIHGKEVIFEIFDACEPGDLLVMLLGRVEKHLLPGYIREYARL